MLQTRTRLFIQLQFSLLLAALTVLPSFDIIAIVSGFDGIAVSICKLGAAIWGILALTRLMKDKKGNENPMVFITCAGIGLVLVLLSLFGLPMWCDYVAMILLFIAMFLNKGALNMRWNSLGGQGAFFILMALLLRLYQHVDDTTCTGIAALIGLILYYKGLTKISSAMDANGIAAVSKLKTAFIIGLIGVIIDFIPLLGWLAVVLAVIAFIFEYLGYSQLKTSTAVGNQGQQGAKNLCISMILIIIGCLLGFIPVFGNFIEAIITLVVIYLVFNGWQKILTSIEGTTEPVQQ